MTRDKYNYLIVPSRASASFPCSIPATVTASVASREPSSVSIALVSSALCRLSKAVQFFWDHLLALLEYLDEFLRQSPIGSSEESYSRSCFSSSPSSPDSVHVVFNSHWEIIVDDQAYIFDIYVIPYLVL